MEIKKKNKNIDFNIKREIVKKVKPFAPDEKVCLLYLQEKKKLSILRPASSLINKNKIFGHCMLRKRFQLNHSNNLQSSGESPI